MSLIMVLSFFAAIALSVGINSIKEYYAWRGEIHQKAIIIPSSPEAAQKIILSLKSFVANIKLMDKSQIRDLLEPWLAGLDQSSKSNPVIDDGVIPAIIFVELSDKYDAVQLLVRLEEIDKSAVFHNSQPIENLTAGALSSLLLSSIIALILAVLAIIISARMASEYLVKIHEPTIIIIHLLGMPDNQLISIFTQFGRMIGLIGASIGAFLALLAIIIHDSLSFANNILPNKWSLISLEWFGPLIILALLHFAISREIKSAIVKYTLIP